MFNITFNGIITVNRGDSFVMPLFINVGNNIDPQRYVLGQHDVVFMGVMEPNQPFEDAIIRKRFTSDDLNEDGDVMIRFRPEDTQCLIPGKYYYQVKLQTFASDNSNDYEVSTVVDKTEFFITE